MHTKTPSTHTHQPVRAGALTLLLTVVTLLLSVLGVLALSTARADLKMAEKQQALLARDARVEAAGQVWLAQLDAALQAGTALPKDAVRQPDGTIAAALAVEDGVTLHITVQPQQETDGARYRICRWQAEYPWKADDELQLWDGN